MKPFIDEQQLSRMNAELKRALAEGDPDILAGRFSPVRPEPKAAASSKEPALAGAESGRKRAG